MVDRKECREAWVWWQMAESRERGWAFEDCLTSRNKYQQIRDQYRDEHGEEWWEEEEEDEV